MDWLARKGVDISNSYTLFNSDIALPNSQLQGKEDNLALFNKTQWELLGFNIDVGIRYDWLKQTSQTQSITEDNVSGSLAFGRRLYEKLSVNYELASGFRYPTLSERYFSGVTPRGIIIGNEALESERSLGNQIGLTWQVADGVALHGSVYHYALTNYIERYRTDENSLTYRNLGNAHIVGVEAELNWRVNDRFSNQITLASQQGEDDAGETLSDIQPTQLSWIVLYYFSDFTISNSVSYTFDETDYSSSEQALESYTLWDISLDYQASDNLNLAFVLNNLLNEEYRASLDDLAPLQPERSIKLSANWQF